MRIRIFIFFFWVISFTSYAQNNTIPHLDTAMMKNGLAILSFKEAWKYHKGDDMLWADPNFKDTTWQNIAPEGLSLKTINDNWWEGYGWWRLTFTMDSALYSQISRLHFRSWGAAEVYLDGIRISTYGTYSSKPANEKNYIPRYVLDNTIKVTPSPVHVLAIRYSNHQAKRNQALLKHNAPFLGFTIGFANEAKAANAERSFAGYIGSHSIVTAILLLLLIIHVFLLLKFPKDTSNLAIIGVVILFLISIATNYAGLFIDITGFDNALLRGLINSAAFGSGLVLLPYTLSLIFRLDKFKWTKHLIWLVLLRSIIYFFPILPIIIPDSIFILIVFVSISLMMFQAIKGKRQGVHYLTVAAICTTIFILIDRLYATNVIELSTEVFYIVLVFTFISFPVGLSLYITNRYATLFSSMEQEVANRTFDLNKSMEALKSTQVSLTAKNAENELLLKEIHHRVKNNLEIVSSLLELQSAQIDDPSVQAAMLSSQNRVHSMSIIHQKLYQGERLASIEMKDYFTQLGQNILNSFNAEGRIKVECDMPKLILDVDTAISIGLITNELLTNSLKYAFEKKVKGTIKISMNEKNTEGVLLLTVSDDGIGKPSDTKAKGTGFGTQLINLLTKQLDATLTYEVNNGTTAQLAFKKVKLEMS